MPTLKLVATNPPRPLPSSTLTLALPLLAETTSSFLSPLKSPTATELGLDPTGKLTAAPNPPRPLPSSTLTLLLLLLAETTSSFISPLKSPTATELGPDPTRKLVAVPKRVGGMPAKSEAPLGSMSEVPLPDMSRPHASPFAQRVSRKGSQMELQLREERRLAMVTQRTLERQPSLMANTPESSVLGQRSIKRRYSILPTTDRSVTTDRRCQ